MDYHVIIFSFNILTSHRVSQYIAARYASPSQSSPTIRSRQALIQTHPKRALPSGSLLTDMFIRPTTAAAGATDNHPRAKVYRRLMRRHGHYRGTTEFIYRVLR